MVMFKRGNGSKAVDSEWHRERQRAREIAFSINEFGDTEISKYDLETAQITGEDNPRTYTINRPIDTLGVNGHDLREDNNR